MHRPHLRRSSVVTVVAAAALVVVTGGTSTYAAHLITSKEIKNNTIKSIDVRNGTLTSADLAPGTIPGPYAGSYAYSTYHDAGVNYQNGATVLTLEIPTAGSYVVDASTWLLNGATPVLARCVLSAGGDSDTKRTFLEAAGSDKASYATVGLQTVHTFTAAGTATLTCDNFGAPGGAYNSKITAIKVDHLSNVAG